MPKREAFLRTICDHPDDDGPRLVYADWLDEQGDPLGEIIRLECERARLPLSDTAGRRMLTERADAIDAQNESRSMVELPPLEGVTWLRFSRGFADTIVIDTATRFLDHAETVFRAAPVNQVFFTALDAAGAALLAESPWLLKLRLLKNFGTPMGDDGVRSIANSKHSANLRRLFLNGNQIHDEGARAIAKSKWFGELTTLFLHNNNITDDGARLLAESKRLPKVTEVYLVQNEIREAGTAALRERWGSRAFLE
jgi:uncharacterized protein (TIGR02996 family)